ncbi:YjzD family protein [Macrococcus equipercicus]|uniref:DUF2929 family protein n=1 Tax=Macrococcus equipercicus TaxID=69967 RepID=A0A9Q9F2I7_9STAP|nr:YjzD family protein [Macrococcus equipercicus]KAA1042581.1 DUF2929 family protein [Macrococcus equipercicus]UTH14441.1 YjzD family protein [Macrococcus equipercicus]
MQYIMTFVWSFILVHMINFVLMSLGGGQALHLATASLLSVIFAVLVILISMTLPDDPVPHHSEH